MLTVIGQLATSAGLVEQRDLAGDPDPFTLRANDYLRHQPVPIPVLFDHDYTWPIGEVGYAERSKVDGLLLVARIRDDALADLLDDGDWYLSAGVRCTPTGTLRYGLARIHELSLVRSAANLNTKPVAWSRLDIARDGGGQPHMPLRWRDTWRRAHETMSARRYRRAADHLAIVDMDTLDLYDEVMTDPASARRRAAAMPPLAKPAPKVAPVPTGPRVRFHGVWLDEARSAELLDALEFGYS